MKSLFLSLLLLITACAANAQVPSISPACPTTPAITVPQGSSVTLVWVAPTLNTDGSTIVTGLLSYSLYSLVPGVAPSRLALELTTPTNTRTNLLPGSPCYAVTASANGIESNLSTPLSILVTPTPPTPNPPTKLSCTISIPVGGAPVTGTCAVSP